MCRSRGSSSCRRASSPLRCELRDTVLLSHHCWFPGDVWSPGCRSCVLGFLKEKLIHSSHLGCVLCVYRMEAMRRLGTQARRLPWTASPKSHGLTDVGAADALLLESGPGCDPEGCVLFSPAPCFSLFLATVSRAPLCRWPSCVSFPHRSPPPMGEDF